MRPIDTQGSKVVAAIDVGSSKIVCMIARLSACSPFEALPRRTHRIEVLSAAHNNSRGMKAGNVSNAGHVQEMVRNAVDLAERKTGLRVESAIVSMSGGRIASELLQSSVDVIGAVSRDDVSRVLAAATRNAVRQGRATLHSLPTGYSVDAMSGIADPRNMVTRCLGAEVHVVSTEIAAARNLMLALESCHVATQAIVMSAYAAGLSALADDEADLGAVVIDMGAETTTIAAFSKGRFVWADGFALGGLHLTRDLARGLGAKISDAERIKTSYGILPSGDMINMQKLDTNGPQAPRYLLRSAVVHMIQPRIEEILEIIHDRLAASPIATSVPGQVVLTGGASQLPGLCELASRVLHRPVRIGRPFGIVGLPRTLLGPASAVVAGLLVYPEVAHLEYFNPRHIRRTSPTGYIAEVGQWLRENF
jgi:cell division protein FtsA